MVFKRGLNLHIAFEGLSSRHYNTHVNFKLMVKTWIGGLFGFWHL
jgi:hypothetical protein